MQVLVYVHARVYTHPCMIRNLIDVLKLNVIEISTRELRSV